MPSTEKIIQKLYREVLESEDESIDPAKDVHFVLEYCENNNRLTEHEGNYFAFVRSVDKEDKTAVRMIFSVKQGKKKVCNVEKIMSLIRSMENALIYVDSCKTHTEDNFVHLDVKKRIT